MSGLFEVRHLDEERANFWRFYDTDVFVGYLELSDPAAAEAVCAALNVFYKRSGSAPAELP